MLVKICPPIRCRWSTSFAARRRSSNWRAGCEHVLDSSCDLQQELVDAIAATGATIAFDAIAAARSAADPRGDGAGREPLDEDVQPLWLVDAQAASYISAPRSVATQIARTFGLSWNIGGYL